MTKGLALLLIDVESLLLRTYYDNYVTQQVFLIGSFKRKTTIKKPEKIAVLNNTKIKFLCSFPYMLP